MDIDVIDTCSRASFETFQVLDKDLYPSEYEHAQNLYTFLLLGCCCLYMIDNGHESEVNDIVEDVHRFWKEEMPFSFSFWMYDSYKRVDELDQLLFDSHFTRDDLDEYRASSGHKIASYILDKYTYTSQYDMFKTKLFDELKDTLDYLSHSLSFSEDDDTDKALPAANTKETPSVVEYNDISGFFPSIWTSGNEYLWFSKAWDILTKHGMASYVSPLDEKKGILRAAALSMIYIDFCKVTFDEDHGYEEIAEEMPYHLEDNGEMGFVYAQLSENKSYPGFNACLIELTDAMRKEVFNTLQTELDDEKMCLGMYLTAIDEDCIYYDEDADDLEADENIMVNLKDAQSYWQSIEKNHDDIDNTYLDELMPGFEWLREGAYRLDDLENSTDTVY